MYSIDIAPRKLFSLASPHRTATTIAINYWQKMCIIKSYSYVLSRTHTHTRTLHSMQHHMHCEHTINGLLARRHLVAFDAPFVSSHQTHTHTHNKCQTKPNLPVSKVELATKPRGILKSARESRRAFSTMLYATTNVGMLVSVTKRTIVYVLNRSLPLLAPCLCVCVCVRGSSEREFTAYLVVSSKSASPFRALCLCVCVREKNTPLLWRNTHTQANTDSSKRRYVYVRTRLC